MQKVMLPGVTELEASAGFVKQLENFKIDFFFTVHFQFICV